MPTIEEKSMLKKSILATVACAALTIAVPAWAAPADYRLELAGEPDKSGKSTIVKVRLVHTPDGKPVAGAVIVQSRLDMGPEGMPTMTAPVKATTASQDGVYQFEIQPQMAGRWALSLAAKVQGEAEMVRGTVTVTVPK
jgi:hypothetical protein